MIKLSTHQRGGLKVVKIDLPKEALNEVDIVEISEEGTLKMIIGGNRRKYKA